ncbi:MAG: metallophosphatase family protein [Candidatus Omnitrophica bacterium]|nr:metallophosphatase family protein [Candidatus Omnitrophota bacterium]
MRYGIFADIHANLEALEAVFVAYSKEQIDKYLCAGDIVGYASNPKECIEKIEGISAIIVAGNHDWASANLFSLDYFNDLAKEAIFWTKENLSESNQQFLQGLKLTYKNQDLTLVHSTLDNPGDFNYLTDSYIAEETFRLMETQICFLGHTHVPGVFIKKEDKRIIYCQEENIHIHKDYKYIINVGSVGQPRDGIPYASYCIYDTQKKEVWIKRVAYDALTTRNKIIACGLPYFLGERLLIGR